MPISTGNPQALEKPGTLFIAGLALMMTFPPLATDMFLPALTTIGDEFHATQEQVDWTLSIFLFGFAIGQIFWGAISDRAGRRLPIIAGILLYLVGCVGCSLSPSIASLDLWRLVQALGACAGPVLARAMVRDRFEPNEAASVLSIMALIMGAAPLLAPFLGGYTLLFFDWRTIFLVQAGFGILALLAILVMPETLPPHLRLRTSLATLLTNYGILLRDKSFLGYALCSSLMTAGLFAYIAGTPFIYLQIFHVRPEHYGFLFGVNVIGMMVGNAVNAKIVGRFGAALMLRAGCVMAAVVGIFLLFFAGTGLGGLLSLVAVMFFLLSLGGLISANSMSLGMSHFPRIAGSASALMGTLQFGYGAIAAWAVGYFANGTALPMAAIICAAGCAAAITNLWLCKTGR
jgi:DHA1 family bicyclomycin/chloramphenicol resistance-like MFS transporter